MMMYSLDQLIHPQAYVISKSNLKADRHIIQLSYSNYTSTDIKMVSAFVEKWNIPVGSTLKLYGLSQE